MSFFKTVLEDIQRNIEAMEPALDHHYRANSHHPEHYAQEFGEIHPGILSSGEAIRDMSLLDIVEMLCDWKAATMRHDFTGLKFDTDYSFTYKENGLESNPMVVHTPVKKNPSAPTVQIVAQ